MTQDITDVSPAGLSFANDIARLRFAMTAAGIGVWEVDVATNQVLWDDRCSELFGLSGVKVLTYEEAASYIHPDDLANVNRSVQAALQGENGGQYNVTYRTLGADNGKLRLVNFTGAAYFDKVGQVTRFGGVAQDVTETFNQQHKTLRFQQQIISLLEQSEVAIAIIAKESLTFTAANSFYSEMVGRTPAEIIGRSLGDVFPEVEIKDFEALLQGVLATGVLYLAKEARIETLVNGKPKISFVNFAYQPLVDDTKVPYAILVVATDVTSQVVSKQKFEESEQNLRHTILQAPFAICVFRGPKFVIEIANDKMFEFWGKSTEQVMNKPLFEGIPEAKGQGYEELLSNVLETGEPFSARELPVVLLRNGIPQTVLIDFSYQPMEDADGSFTGIMATAIDVTEQVTARRKIENAKAEAERQKRLYETVTASTPDLIYVFDKHYHFTYANKALLEMSGKTWEQAIGKGLLENGYEPWHAEMHEREIDQVIATKAPIRGEVSFLHATLGKRIYDYIFVPIFDDNGEVESIAGTTRDITEIKNAETLVRESEEQLRFALDAGGLGSWELDLDTMVLHASKHCKGNFGQSLNKPFTYETLVSCIHPDDRQRQEEAVQKTVNTGADYDIEYRVIWPNGSLHWANIRGQLKYNKEGKPVRMAGISVDITQRVMARQEIEAVVEDRTKALAEANAALQLVNKELQRSNSHLEEFAHAASHDLKEPVRKIHFFTNKLKNELGTVLNDTHHNALSRIENATERMGALIDDLLLYSHVSQRPHEKEPVDLNEKISRVLEDLDLDIDEKKATITLRPLPVIRGYGRQLQQLFQNLISNSLKYSKANVSPNIIIQAFEHKEDGTPYHCISIQDNGIGFAQEYHEKIFQMFSRLHGKHEYSGTGVGLSIVKKIVENHDGFIRVESVPEKGTKFSICLPVV